jgi:non-specific serine/threonine protein kinase
MGQPRRAGLLFGSAEAVLQSFAGRSIPVDWADFKENLAVARSQLDEESWEKLWAAGQAMTFDEAIAFAQTVADSDEPSASGARTGGAFHPPGGLTRREQEVALLIAAGKSNREIAEAFVIAERTVEGHVSNVLSKLGFRSRTQVSIWVNENRLSNG